MSPDGKDYHVSAVSSSALVVTKESLHHSNGSAGASMCKVGNGLAREEDQVAVDR